MLKKMMLLATAVAAFAAFAIPATASASEVIDTATSEPITAGTHMHYTGTAEFNTTGVVSRVACPVTATVEWESATAGKIKDFNVTNFAGCAVEGALEGCSLTGIDPNGGNGVNWPLNTNGTDLKLTSVAFTDTFAPSPPCPGEAHFSASELTVTLPNAPSLDTLTVEGTGSVNITGVGTVEAHVHAHVTITSGEAGTWELG